MSRGFVKEGDQEEAPNIPPRAVIPEGVPNYVTPKGFDALQKEGDDLIEELASFRDTNETDHRRKAAEIDGRLALLNERINSARVLCIKGQSLDEVKFGTWVTYVIDTMKKPMTIQIVGVDEANVKKRKIAFIAPIAKVMIGKKVGEKTVLELGGESRSIEILKIESD